MVKGLGKPLCNANKMRLLNFQPKSTLKFNDQSQSGELPISDLAQISKDACIDGLTGIFNHVEHDFRGQINKDADAIMQNGAYIFDKNAGLSSEKQKIGRIRYVICSMALVATGLSLMSRLILNVSIVEITKKGPVELMQSLPEEYTQESDSMLLNDTILSEAGQTFLSDTIQPSDWSMREKNFLLAAFYIGYSPSMMLSGSLASKFGSKYPLLVCVISTSIINFLTPTVVRYSLPMLIGLRIVLGIFQGGIVPATFDLFNRWLTLSETSIFVPLIRVSFSLGSMFGAILPGISLSFGHDWPLAFYIASLFCAAWSLVWFQLATTLPQSNKLVTSNELSKIMRKKNTNLGQNTSRDDGQTAIKPPNPPLLKIITHPSVIALTLAKFTYNFGMDFMALELALYLEQIHKISTQMVSAD